MHSSECCHYVTPFKFTFMYYIMPACDDAKIWVWDLPKGGITETLTEASGYLMGHMEKIYFVHYHPLARDILVSSAYDFTVRIWDLSDMTEKLQIMQHPDQVQCIILL